MKKMIFFAFLSTILNPIKPAEHLNKAEANRMIILLQKRRESKILNHRGHKNHKYLKEVADDIETIKYYLKSPKKYEDIFINNILSTCELTVSSQKHKK